MKSPYCVNESGPGHSGWSHTNEMGLGSFPPRPVMAAASRMKRAQSISAAWAAANLAMGTRGPEQET
jgi:hypothetical protein